MWAKVPEYRRRYPEQSTRLEDDVPPEVLDLIVAHGQPLPAAHFVEIATYSDSGGYFLNYCDEHGERFADAWFLTLQEAMGQAEWEYGILAGDWRDEPPLGSSPPV